MTLVTGSVNLFSDTSTSNFKGSRTQTQFNVVNCRAASNFYMSLNEFLIASRVAMAAQTPLLINIINLQLKSLTHGTGFGSRSSQPLPAVRNQKAQA